MADSLIDPQNLIQELGVAGLNHFSNEYYKRMHDPGIPLGKPFSMISQSPQLLVRLGLMLESLRLTPGIKVLDFGSGPCSISKALWQMGYSVIATDVSEEALRLGESLFNDYPIPNQPPCSWETRLFDGHSLPLKAEEIDRIICFDAFHHVPNQEEIVHEFYRVLRNGGTIVLNEPFGLHSTKPASQMEMREYKVLENDMDMTALKSLFCEAGFREPTFKVAANPEYIMSCEEWQTCRTGEISNRMANALSQFQQNSSVFYFQKGKALNDSRQAEGLAHELEISVSKLAFKVGVPQKIQVSFRNVGESRWIDKNGGACRHREFRLENSRLQLKGYLGRQQPVPNSKRNGPRGPLFRRNFGSALNFPTWNLLAQIRPHFRRGLLVRDARLEGSSC